MKKLNIGGGYRRYPDFLNVDNDPLTTPDILCDMGKDKLPLEDNSVDEVMALHILEHIPGEQFFHLLKELYRVCVDSAIIHIEVPHYRHDDFFGDPSHVRPFTIETFKMFSKKYNQFCIDQYGASSPFGIRLDVDFEVIDWDYLYDAEYMDLLNSMSDQERNLFIKTSANVIRTIKVEWCVNK